MSTPTTVSVVLHAHLPYGLRPDLPISLEECWLFEAVTDCYLPLLQLIQKLPQTEQLAVSLSPTLLDMWAHPDFPKRYCGHLDRFAEILDIETDDPQMPSERRELAQLYLDNIQSSKKCFSEAWQADLGSAFGQLANEGKVELLTTAATHAFLPAHQNSELVQQLQINLGVERFTARTGVQPQGFWIPECAYFPGIEDRLASTGIKWFITENMGGPNAIVCPNGVTAIARNNTLSRKVWDARSGYPGHESYREFHQDAVHELPKEKAGLYRTEDGASLPLGLKYWRVTGASEKDWYNPTVARKQAELDAQAFAAALENSPESLVCLPFDAELFGHWWHEGPHWLETVLTHTENSAATQLKSPSQALKSLQNPANGRPKASTWGRQADFSFWINPETDWIYPQLHAAEEIVGQTEESAPVHPLRQRVIDQMIRELLLAQASDWPFMLRAGATAEYAEERLRRHLTRLHYLARELQSGNIDEETLHALEMLDSLFADARLSRR